MKNFERVLFDEGVSPLDPQSVRQVVLASGKPMPVAAFGTFHSDWAQDHMGQATLEAIRLGWRHLDTARAYENEEVIGEAIRQACAKGYIGSAEELFITGKLWNGHMAPQDVQPACDATLKALGVDQIDMYVNHWPWPNVHEPGCQGEHRNPNAVPYIHEAFLETWGELCKLKRAGKVVDIGTSNHTAATMRLLLRDVVGDERPVYNQMEMHPLFQQAELRRFFESEQIVCSGYMALGSPSRPSRDTFKEHRADLSHPVIARIAEDLDTSPAHVALSWAAQRENKSGGYVVMATRSDRLHANLKAATEDLLSPEHLLQIDGDGTPEHPGIDANNRLIWGQVFLWPEAAGDWRILWDDSQVFETRTGYAKFKASWDKHHEVQLETTFINN